MALPIMLDQIPRLGIGQFKLGDDLVVRASLGKKVLDIENQVDQPSLLGANAERVEQGLGVFCL